MARTSLTTNNALTRKLWESKLYHEAPVEAFFGKVSDSTGNNAVHVKKDLTAGSGDKLTFGIRLRAPMNPIVDGRLKGNEQRLSTYDDSVLLHSYKIGYADDGALSRHRAAYDIYEEMLMALKENAVEVIEKLMFDAMFAAGHTNIIYGGDATSVGTLEAGDKLTPAMLAKLYTLGLTGSHRSFPPLRPLKIAGSSYFVLLAHPDVVFDLSQDSTMQQANREARERGASNPLFREAELVYRNIIVMSNERVPIFTNGGAGAIAYSNCMLLGAQALIQADGMPAKIVENRDDYDDLIGLGWHLIAGWKRPTFNSVVNGSIQVTVARTNVAVA